MPDKKTTSTRSAAAKKDAAKKTTAASGKQPVASTETKREGSAPKLEECNNIVLTDEQFAKMMNRFCSNGGGSSTKCCDLNESVKQLADAVDIIANKLVPTDDPRQKERRILSTSLALSDVRTMKTSGNSYRDTDETDIDC